MVNDHSYRAFIAIPVTKTNAAAIHQHQLYLQQYCAANATKIRWFSPNQWHITMAFLGNVTSAQLALCYQRIMNMVALQPSFHIQLNTGIGIPGESPRCMAIAPKNSPELFRLHQRIVDICKSCDISLASRDFLPHMTLARHKLSDDCPGNYCLISPIGLSVTKLTLYNSELSPNGACYKPLKTFSLSNFGRQV